MHKRWLATAAIATALGANGAQADDPSPKGRFSWSGFYIGAQVGHGWATNEWSDFFDPLNPTNTVPGPDAHYDVNGFLAGGYIGYNWQFNRTRHRGRRELGQDRRQR